MGKENTHKQSQGELKNPCDSVCTACNLVLLLRARKENTQSKGGLNNQCSSVCTAADGKGTHNADVEGEHTQSKVWFVSHSAFSL